MLRPRQADRPRLIGRAGLLAQIALFCSLGAGAAGAADAYFSPAGKDAEGYKIGTDCTLAAPCKTVSKALDFLASNIASGAGPNRNYSLAFDGGRGPFQLSSTLIMTSAHTVSNGYATTFDVYNGAQAEWSGGLDTAGTWTSTTLPSGAQGCVSTYLTKLAPLKEANAKYYVGNAWINGHRVQEVINPRSGNPWAQVKGALDGVDRGSSMFLGPVAKFTASNKSIWINDLSRIGIVGDPISFETAPGGIKAEHPYWIVSKSAASGSGNISIAWSPGGAPMIPSGTAQVEIADPVQSANAGDRTNAPGRNTFPFDPATADFKSAYNQTDVKAQVVSWRPNLIPVAGFSGDGGGVFLNSRAFTIYHLLAGNSYRVWNRFEDLGTGGYTGELYTDRTTGKIYYTPRTDLKETCASINAARQSYIPSSLETLLRISSAKADIAEAGGKAGAKVGNLVFRNIVFEHTNTSVFSGVYALAGPVGGYIATEGGHFAGMLNWAVVTVGASNVTFDSVTMAHFGGSAFASGWGSHHNTVENSKLYDAGGSLITAGAALTLYDSYHYNNDQSFFGTDAFGPTTPSFAHTGGAQNPDYTGDSDCCQTFTNNFIYDGGIVHPFMGCMNLAGWQRFTVTYNTMHDCGAHGVSAVTYFTPGPGAPSYSGTVGAVLAGGKVYYPVYGNVFSRNDVYNCGYETTLTGKRVPGGAMLIDFACIYIGGPQDGDGKDPAKALQITYNKIHDVSAAAYSMTKQTSTGWEIRPHGYDGNLLYHDGNNANGIIVKNNLIYNRSTAAVGAPIYPARLTQRTGSMRSVSANNIISGAYPAGYRIYTDYVPRTDSPPIYLIRPAASNKTYAAGACSSGCYVTNKYRIYSSTFTNARTTGSNTLPTCTSGVCVDGGVTWTYVSTFPGKPYLEDYSNITVWKVDGLPGGATNHYAIGNSFADFPEFSQFKNNLYSMIGNNLSKFSSSYLFPKWKAEVGALGTLQDAGSLYGGPTAPDAVGLHPNFVSMETGDFRFKSTYTGAGKAVACGGTGGVSPACALGFVPWDYDNVGAR